jgi:hypothetical protein
VAAAGTVVRHLAAGVLGGQYAPPPPLAQGLSQSLTWDLKDDLGNIVFGSTYKARVRLGLAPKYKYRIDTEAIPGSHRSGVYAPRMWEETVQLTNQIFHRITVEHSNPDLFIRANDAYDEIYVHVTNQSSTDQYRYSCANGQLLNIVKFPGLHERQYWGEIEFSWDGELIYHTTSLEPIYMYTRLGQPRAWPKQNASDPDIFEISGLPQGFTVSRGHAATPDNTLFVCHHSAHRAWETGLVSEISPFGKITRKGFLTIPGPPGGGLRVDKEGNLYAGARIKPGTQGFPTELNSILTPGGDGSLYWWAGEMYGSIVKYTSSGQKVWEYFGLSPTLTHRTYPQGANCNCNVSRFDVDRYGRIFIPDAFRMSVVVLDNSRNEVVRYNHKDWPLKDDNGKAVMPLGWPNAIEATDNGIFISDQINDQVVCLALNVEKKALVDVPVSIEQGIGSTARLTALYRVHPNPVQSSASIRFHLPRRERVDLKIYDIRGKLVQTLLMKEMSKGMHTVKWQPGDMEAGVYMARLRTGQNVRTKRVFVLK